METIEALVNVFLSIGYVGIIILMAIESSFIPFPSEVVIPPAAYLAQQGKLNIWGVIAAGVLGSLVGAVINYYLGLRLGRRLVYRLAAFRYAHWLGINQKKIEQSEQYFRHYGNWSTFVGRLVPAVRQLVSIPAGFSKMNFKYFIFFTFLGSSVWIVILAALGYFVGANKQLLKQYYQEISLAFALGFVLLVAYWIWRAYRKNNNG
ncbi:DedA family protein [Candidatus Parcubacteria bacterium]|nr:MAG: DedA family protein [Candidatus Parcubacteria bacterium]